MKEESSYKLGDIGEKYAKLGKIEYNGNLDTLFRDDPEKFIDYKNGSHWRFYSKLFSSALHILALLDLE